MRRTVSTALARGLCVGVASYGGAPERFLAEVGLRPELVADPDARMPHARAIALWQRVAAFTGDPDFGLHAAELNARARLSLGAADVIDCLAQASATLGEALERLARYHRLLHEELLELRLATSGGEAWLSAEHLGVPPGSLRHAAEFCLATILLRMQRALGQVLALRAVTFRHAKPARIAEHRRIFGAPLRFGAEVDALAFDRALLDAPMGGGDARLVEVLERHAQGLVSRLPSPGELVPRLREALLQATQGGEVAMSAVARRMGMGARTLQRRLDEEGTSFRQVLDEVRRERALALVAAGELSVAEISFLLGFSEPRAFHRAFRRWAKTTPAAFRRARD